MTNKKENMLEKKKTWCLTTRRHVHEVSLNFLLVWAVAVCDQ